MSSWGENDHWLTNSEISARTKLPKPTVARLTYTLCAEGYLRHSRETGKYAPGNSMYVMGIDFLANIKARKIAKPYMQELADHFNASVSMGINDGLSMVYIENCHTTTPLTLGLGIGAKLPVAQSAIGHSYLFSLPEAEQNILINEFEIHYGNEWPAIKDNIEKSRQEWKSLGFTTGVRGWLNDISGIGFTIMSNDEIRYSFNLGGTATKFSREHLVNDIGPRMLRVMKIIESLIKN